MSRHRLGLVAAFGVGILLALQARINGELGRRLHDGLLAAFVSFCVGLLLLGVGLSASGRFRAGVRGVWRACAAGTLRPWQFVGGFFGAFLVACQGLTVTSLGVAMFTVAVVAGQVLSSLWVDRLGIGPSGRTPVTLLRVVGAVLAVVAVAVASAGELGNSGSVGLVVLPVLAGIGVAWQQALNGRIGTAGGPFAAALVNFGVGTVALVVVAAIAVAVRGFPSSFPTNPLFYVGGALGLAFIAAAALVVRWIGVLLLGLSAVAGQLVGAVALDALTPTGPGLSVTAVVGCVLTLGAVSVAALSGRGR